MSAVIWWSQNNFLHYGLTRLCYLDVEAVVADKTKEGAITIGAIISHHFLHGNYTCTGTLVDDKARGIQPKTNGYVRNELGAIPEQSSHTWSFICRRILIEILRKIGKLQRLIDFIDTFQ